LVDRDELLAEFDGWGPVKRDLQAFLPKFELLPLIASAMNGIRDVHKACMGIDLDQALAQSTMLAEVLDRIESTEADGEPSVFRYRRTTKTHMDITPGLIPSDAVRKLHSGRPGRCESRQSVVNARRHHAAGF
jgi:hypothetical protein